MSTTDIPNKQALVKFMCKTKFVFAIIYFNILTRSRYHKYRFLTPKGPHAAGFLTHQCSDPTPLFLTCRCFSRLCLEFVYILQYNSKRPSDQNPFCHLSQMSFLTTGSYQRCFNQQDQTWPPHDKAYRSVRRLQHTTSFWLYHCP